MFERGNFVRKKRLMVIGAGALQVPLIKRIKERGYEVVVVSPDQSEPGFFYADFSVITDVKSQEYILKIAQKMEIDGVVTDQTDLAVRTVAYVSENLRLPSIGYEKSLLFTDKVLMRKKCEELNLNPIPYKIVNYVDEAIQFLKLLNKPAIIKPADSQASKGVHKIENEEDLILNFDDAKKYSRDGNVIVEQYINGLELLVDSMVVNNEVKVLTIGEYTPFLEKDVFSSHKTIFPSPCSDSVKEKIIEFNNRLIHAFELNNSRTHAEYLYDGEKVFLVEIAARGGGVFISSDAVKYCAGINNEDFLIDIALGNTNMPIPISNFKPQCFGELFFYLPEGVITKVEGLDKVLQLPYVHSCLTSELEVGKRTPPLTDKNERKLITVTGKDYEELEYRMEKIRHMLDVQVKTNSKTRGIIWE